MTEKGGRKNGQRFPLLTLVKCVILVAPRLSPSLHLVYPALLAPSNY